MSNVWFVTGSSRGLGRAVVQAALAAGHRVVATARDPSTLESMVSQYPDQLLAYPLEVSDPAQAQAAVRAAVHRFGRLDVVVNNAGYAQLAPIEEVDMADFRKQVDAVFYGTVYVTKAALPIFLRQGGGHFIQVASTGGRLTTPGVAAYQSAKFAVEGFSGVLRRETAPLGVKVTLAEPGLMRTDWSGSSMDIPPSRAAYEPVLGPVATRLRAMNGREPVDPAKVAQVFLDIAEMKQPPLHLVLGKGAVDMMAREMSDLVASDLGWAAVGRSVDFDEKDFDETDFDEKDFDETDFDETDSDETDFDETDFDRTDFDETDVGKADSDRTDT